MATKIGSHGKDYLVGTLEADLIFAFEGNDTLKGGRGNDYLYGGAGNDVVSGDAGNDRVDGERGDDVVLGGDGNDILKGGTGNDRLYGGAGRDIFSGNAGNDKLYGGAGNDELKGNEGNDTIRGDAGNDYLSGGTGNDTLQGDLGVDTLNGGAGADKLILQYSRGYDHVLGFEHGLDKLVLSAAAFHLASPIAGALTANEFLAVSGHTATTPDQRLIYDTDTKQLYADLDGNGTAYAPILIADFKAAPSILASDFLIVA